jgi:hypothetical protein
MSLQVGRWWILAGKGMGNRTSVIRGRCSHNTASQLRLDLRGYFFAVIKRDLIA